MSSLLRKTSIIGLGLLLILVGVVAVSGLAWAGEITVLAPTATDAVVLSRNRIVNVVVKVTDSADLAKLHLYSEKYDRSYDPEGRYGKDGSYYLHYILHLKKGNNAFTLDPGGIPIRIKFKPMSTLLNADFTGPRTYLFHRQEISPPVCQSCHTKKLPSATRQGLAGFDQASPECYSCHQSTTLGAEWPHSPATRLICRSCHPEETGLTKVAVPTGKVEDLCFTCHVNQQKWTAMAHIHGPVGTGDCTICHDPHGGKNRYQLWAGGGGRLCVICHEDKKKFLADTPRQKLRVHGILKARGCVACHSPHATEHRFQLLAGINDLCTSCHPALQGMKQDHPVQRHPLTGVADPLRLGRKMVCTSCHDPHGSEYDYLLIGESRGGLLCAKCHSGQPRKNRYGR